MFELTIFLSEGGTAVPIIVGQPERCAQRSVCNWGCIIEKKTKASDGVT